MRKLSLALVICLCFVLLAQAATPELPRIATAQ